MPAMLGIVIQWTMTSPHEGHGFSNEENQFEAYAAMENFFAKHLGGRTEQARN